MPSTKASKTSLSREARLTKAELESWSSFTAPAWAPFREAWIGRGLHRAPAGKPDDDDTSQRGLLWQVADARPHDLARWVSEAPFSPNKPKSTAIIDYVLEQWHSTREGVESALDIEEARWVEEVQAEAEAAITALNRLGWS